MIGGWAKLRATGRDGGVRRDTAWWRHRLSGHVVGNAERAVEVAGARQWELVADRLGRPHLLTTAYEGGNECRCSRFAAPTARGCGRRSRRTDARFGAPEERVRLGHGATDGERVYVAFGTRGLFAVDLAGKLVWQRDLGPINNYHGAAGSPLLYKDRVIIYQDQ